MLKFYSHPISPWAKRVQFLMEEMVLPFETISIKLQEKQHLQPSYSEINPASRVPALEDGDFKLAESGAIMRYLVAKYARTDFYPVNLKDRAKVDEMFEFTTFHICKPILELAWHRTLVKKYNQVGEQNIIDNAEKKLKRDFLLLENNLIGRNFLVNHECTLADINTVPFVALHEYAHWPINNYPRVKNWYDKMTARPAWLRCQ